MMYDRRVARGSTVAQPVVAPSVAEEQARLAGVDEERRKRKLADSRRRAEAEERARLLEVPPVPGRLHSEVRQISARGGMRAAPPRTTAT